MLTSCDFKTTFQYGASPKTFSFEDITDYAAQGVGLAEVTGVFEITDPAANLIYSNTDFTDPDIDPDVILTSVKTILLPLDANGNVLQGDYIIKYSVRGSSDTISPAVDVDKTYTHTLSYSSPTISLNLTANCVKPLLQSTDQTNYTSGTTDPTITRAHSIIYPEALNKANITGTGVSLETNVFYTKKGTALSHSSSLTSTLTYDFGSNLIVTDSISGTKYVDVTCDGELCDVYCCLKAEWDRYTSNQGINDEKAGDHLANWHQMIGLANQIRIALECGKDAHITAFVNRILDLGNCESGCECDDGEPQLVTGLGGGVDTFVVDSAGTPIIVTSSKTGSTTTYTVKLASDFVTKVNNSYNTVVTAGSGATITPTTDSSGNKTYKISFTDTSVEPDILSFIVGLAIANKSSLPIITISNITKYGSAFGTASNVTNYQTTAADWLKINNAFKMDNMWSNQESKVFKPHIEVIEVTFRSALQQAYIGTKVNGIHAEITDTNSTDLNFRLFDDYSFLTTGNEINEYYKNIKLQITLKA